MPTRPRFNPGGASGGPLDRDPIGRSRSNPVGDLALIVASTQVQDVTLPQSLMPFDFGFVNVTTGESARQGHRMVPGGTSQANQIGVKMPARGSVVGVSFSSTADKTAGTASWTVYVDGSASEVTLDWGDDTASGSMMFTDLEAQFEQDSLIDVRLTTDGSMAPTTNDVIVTLFVLLNPTTAL